MPEHLQSPLPEMARRRLRENIALIGGRIEDTCSRAGRPPGSVTLVAVTKYVAADVAMALLDLGVTDLAESRPQVLWEKAAALRPHEARPRWHLIGHLQRNKIRRTLPVLTMLQSLDSLRLLEALEAEASRMTRVPSANEPCLFLNALVEVNLTDDHGRSGASFSDVPALVEAAARSPFVRLRGLMGMAGEPGDGTDARRDFARLRELRDHLAPSLADPSVLDELSMGMSDDFEAGILEGATIVRIGSALFEGID